MNQPTNGRVRDARSLKKLELIWFLSLLSVAAAVILLLSLTGATTPETAVTIVAWTFVPAAGIVSVWVRRQRQRANSMALDDVRERIDVEAVRSVKASKGEVRAVKELRRQEPRLSLKDAAELVRQL
ncbi:hypothetical protein [Streptomyces marispadix]|uniref:Uncharacterized protein n=1 Tax=Streptomyces marispadix TaxID=2922868 RepID=A0ABS9T3C4_9ACTN|nr:hypothetical protein [Streptomyces marispadix]MCH6162953.1 hypothetical protein [Streptomyces marispadix]